MKFKNIAMFYTIACSLVLAGCGGDININEGDITTSTTTNTTINNPPPSTGGGSGSGDDTPTAAGTEDPFLSNQVSNALGVNVEVRALTGVLSDNATTKSLDGDGRIVLTNDTIWALKGPVFVGNDKADATVLEIEPGTIIFGSEGADYLVVSRDSQIEVNGTASQPVIMTSLNDVLGDTVGAGQWGGLVILGNAPSNKCPETGDCALQIEGAQEGAVFGGTDTADDSGSINYLVLKYAGFEIAPDNELNGVTFGGVGSGTEVNYLQVHSNADDGVEFFGGNVNVKYLVLTGNQDDSVDWDNGYQGKLQHVYIQHDRADGDANRAIEADNDGSTPDKTPQSNPMIANMTIIGNNFDGENDSEGVYLREGTGAQIYNMVVTGPEGMGECLEVENIPESQANLTDGTISISNSVMACSNDENFKSDTANGAVDLEDWFLNTQSNNRVLESASLNNDGSPTSGSPLLGAGTDPSAIDSFFDTTDYIGAVGDTDWRQGWAFGFGGGTVGVVQSVSGCPAGTFAIAPVDGSTNTCEVTGRLTSDLTLTAGNIYSLSGAVFVGGDNADSATLSIEAGVTVYGASGNDYLIISRGSQIDAQGTQSAPITFTSKQAV